MAPIKKPRADSKLKNLAETDQETLWLLMHPTDSTVPAYTLEAAQVHVLEEHGVQVGLSSLSEWHSWYGLGRRMDRAAERANQTRIALAKDSDLSPDDIDRVAQTVFMAETLEAGNVKGYVAVAKLRLANRQLDNDDRKIALLEAAAADAKAKLLEVTSAAKSKGGISAETLAVIEHAANLL